MFEGIQIFFKKPRNQYLVGIGVLIGVFLYVGLMSAPRVFPTQTTIVIEEGMTVTDAARFLEEENVVHSSGLFASLVRLFSNGTGVRSGSYTFEKRLSVFEVTHRFITGNTGASLVRITIPEGSTVREIGVLFDGTFERFDQEEFTRVATPLEGYLFPETYFFTPDVSARTVIEVMRETFNLRILEVQEEIDAYGVPLSEVVIMASLLEREARRFETKQTVAGILWKRIDEGIPLQVDAVFGYILGVPTFSPTFEQLEIESPYNTYQNLGLPPGPIANPGLDSILAAVTPKQSPYLYYLTGADGTMHYASTFDEHVANRRFLR